MIFALVCTQLHCSSSMHERPAQMIVTMHAGKKLNVLSFGDEAEDELDSGTVSNT